MKIHIFIVGERRTACGMTCYPTTWKGEADTADNNRIEFTHDWKAATCLRCLSTRAGTKPGTSATVRTDAEPTK